MGSALENRAETSDCVFEHVEIIVAGRDTPHSRVLGVYVKKQIKCVNTNLVFVREIRKSGVDGGSE